MLIGKRASVVFYIVELMLPFVAILVAAICGAMPWWSLAVVVALKPAIDNCRAMLKLPIEGMKALIGVDEKTAQLQLVFSLLLSVSLFVAAML